MRLLFLCLFISIYTYSQDIKVVNISSFNYAVLDSLNNRILLFYNNHYESVNLKTNVVDSIPLYYEEDFKLNDFNPIMVKSVPYFIQEGGGVVYQFRNDSIKRIDHSYNYRMQYGSNIFVHNDTIFRYGGYGFWSVRNFVIYFDMQHSREWEIVKPIHSKNIPQGSHYGFHIINGDFAYFFGGNKLSQTDRISVIPNDDIWQFNLKTKTWNYLGKSDHNIINEHLGFIKYGQQYIDLGKTNTTSIELIDVINNSVKILQRSNLSLKVGLAMTPIYYHHKFYCLTEQSGKILFSAIAEEDFFGKKISEDVLYKNNMWWFGKGFFYSITIVVLLLFLYVFLKQFKKLNKAVLLKNGMRHINKFLEFDEESMTIIKLLLSEKEVASTSILKIVEKQHLSPAHNERLKVQIIKDINLKVKSLLGINTDVIQEKKSKYDRRARVYFILKRYFA